MLYHRKHFYSNLNNLSNLSHSKLSIVPFAKFRSDVNNATKHFPTMQSFANILQNRSSYKFPDIRKIISVLLESLFNKVTRLMAGYFIKNRPLHRCVSVNITKCLRMAFFMEHLPWLLLKMVE